MNDAISFVSIKKTIGGANRMQSNFVLEKLRRGEKTFGSFLGMGSPTVAELLAYAGCEWLLIEMEHNGLDMAQVEHILMAVKGTDTVPLVRIPVGRSGLHPEIAGHWRNGDCCADGQDRCRGRGNRARLPLPS